MKISISPKELDLLIAEIEKQPELLNTDFINKHYCNNSHTVISNPFDDTITNKIIKAIYDNVGYSVIRMGDGEMNILSYAQYTQFPELSYLTAKKSVFKREHSFNVTKTWLLILQKMMETAINEADIVGVLGLWRPNSISSNQFISTLNTNIRGKWGQWTGLSYMKKLSESGLFKNKIISSAHLYFNVISNLNRLFQHAKVIYLITNKVEVKEILTKKYNNTFRLIYTPETKRPLVNSEPEFLSNTIEKLPLNMKNTLTLVGSGPWSEYYCTWIKRRNGVAVDIGSGFDLILGIKLRPVHKKVDINLQLK